MSAETPFDLKFTSREVTAWGGLALLKRMLDGMGFRQAVQSWDLPPPARCDAHGTNARAGIIECIHCENGSSLLFAARSISDQPSPSLMGVKVVVESLSRLSWNHCPVARGIRTFLAQRSYLRYDQVSFNKERR